MGTRAKSLNQIRSEACNAILLTLTLLGVPAVGFSLLRWFEQGWQPVMGVHVVLLLIVAFTAIRRDSLSLDVRAGVATAAPYIVATSGLIFFGRGNGVTMFYVSAIVVAGCFFDRRIGLAVVGLCFATLTAIYAASQLDFLPVPLSPTAFDMSPLSWIAFGASFVAAGVAPLIGLSGLLRMLDTERRRADEAAKARADFLANMSHELRTPMAGILGMADVLKTTPLSEQQRSLIANLTHSARNLLGVLNDVLEFSKYETGHVPIETAPFRVSETMQNVCALMEDKAARKGISLRVETRELTLDHVVGDSLRIGQVLTNLIDNAIKFTAHGGVIVRVSQATRADGDSDLKFAVIDTGCGITDDQAERIFEPFIQADMSTSRTHGGTGLGLSICRRLAKAMGGSLAVTSQPGSGATFTFTVPVRPIVDAPISTARVEDLPAPQQAADQHARLRLLLVDDDRNMRTLAQIMLERRGHIVALAEDGAAAITAAAASPYDCILLDMHMPVMNGLEVMRIIQDAQAKSPCLRTPMIALTADILPEHVRKFIEAGADAVVAKPVDWNLLDSKVQELTRARLASKAS